MEIKIPKFIDGKDAIVDIINEDEYVHTAWMLGDGKIISYEKIWENYPSSSICIHENLFEYLSDIDETWVVYGIKDEDILLNLLNKKQADQEYLNELEDLFIDKRVFKRVLKRYQF